MNDSIENIKRKWQKVLDDLKDTSFTPKKRPKDKIVEVVLTQDVPRPK